MRLRSFTSEVLVGGAMKRVHWDGSILSISPVESYDEALKLLGVDQGHPVEWNENDAAEPPKLAPDHPHPRPTPPKVLLTAPPLSTSGGRTNGKIRGDAVPPAPKVATASASNGPRGAPPTPSPQDDDDIPFGDRDEKASDLPELAEASDDAQGEFITAGGSKDDVQGEFLAGLIAQSSIRGLIQHFFDNGLTDRNDIVAICKQHKKVVPALQRVSNIDDRLGRALEALEAS